jgi:hypothetical protein
MKNNSIWFDSPLPKLAPLPALRQPEADPEDSHFAKAHQYSPDPLPPDRFQPQPLSPWSSLVDADHDHKCAHLSLPGLFPGRQQEVIEERLVYSEEEEEEDLATPQRRGEQCGESEEEGELHTTGRKSQFEQRQRIRKPRPRDKGLRKLSEKAFDIVRDMRNATYKDVAYRLVQEISEEDLEGEVLRAISRTGRSRISSAGCTMHSTSSSPLACSGRTAGRSSVRRTSKPLAWKTQALKKSIN